MRSQQGQTLIETLVAAFILVMGIAAALGLATYSLGATTNIRQQTIAMGLAREGLEVTKNIRDTNWLNDTLSPSCYNHEDGSANAYCYTDWLSPASSNGQSIDPGFTGSKSYFLKFNSNLAKQWTLEPSNTLFGLNLSNQLSGGATNGEAYYHTGNGVTATSGTSGFARKITITAETFPPFDKNTGPRLKVTSQVWWKEKNCPMTDDVNLSSRCLVTLETYLTNWKNF